MRGYRIAFYGFRHGHVNTLYRKILDRADMTVVACVEPDAEARASAEKTLGIHFSRLSLDELLKMDFDILAVGAVYGERGEIIIKALKSGKHVITDKPVCTRKEELFEIRELTRASGLSLSCMLDLRYLPASLRAAELLSSGELGQIRNVSFNGQHYIDPEHRPRWYFEEGMHGGTVNDLAIHGIDLVRMLTGLEISDVNAVRTWNSYAVLHPNFKDSAIFMATLENGAGLLADVSYSAPSQCFAMPTYWEFRFWCENGLLTFSYNTPDVTVYKNGESTPVVLEGKAPERDYVDELIYEIESGGRALTEGVLASTEAALTLQTYAD